MVVKTDSQLTFKTHVNDICNKVRQKLNALAKKEKTYVDFLWKRSLLNAFFLVNFNYCLLCHNRIKNKINRLHEKCLRLIYFYAKSPFEELLEKENYVSVHHINLRVLAVEMYKAYMGLSKELISEISTLRQESQIQF